MSALVQVTDVVHAGAKTIAAQRERMRPPARAVMLFEHENFLPRLCECDRSGESARTRADDDGVIVGQGDPADS